MSLQYDAEARQNVLLRHIGMVHRALEFFPAEAYKRIGIEREDLFQEGCVALVQAMERFDPSKNVAFSSFVFQRIRGAMVDFIRNQQIVSRNILEKKKLMTQISSRYYQEFERPPTENEMIAEMNMSISSFRRLLVGIEASSQVIDLDHPYSEDDPGLTLASLVLVSEDRPVESIIVAQGIEIMEELLSRLTPREREAIQLFYLEAKSATECASIMQMQVCTCSAFRGRILKKLRAIVEAMDSAKRSLLLEAMREMRA